jgi:hypothetical protein
MFSKRVSKYGCLRAECVAIIPTMVSQSAMVVVVRGHKLEVSNWCLWLPNTHTQEDQNDHKWVIFQLPRIRTSTAIRHRRLVSKPSMMLKMSSPPHSWATNVSWLLPISKVENEDPLNSTAPLHIDNRRIKTPHDS